MIYLIRFHDGDLPDIAVVEDARKAASYEQRGYIRCSRAIFRAAWRLLDEHALRDLWPEEAPKARVEDAPKATRVVRIGNWVVPEGYIPEDYTAP